MSGNAIINGNFCLPGSNIFPNLLGNTGVIWMPKTYIVKNWTNSIFINIETIKYGKVEQRQTCSPRREAARSKSGGCGKLLPISISIAIELIIINMIICPLPGAQIIGRFRHKWGQIEGAAATACGEREEREPADNRDASSAAAHGKSAAGKGAGAAGAEQKCADEG